MNKYTKQHKIRIQLTIYAFLYEFFTPIVPLYTKAKL